MIEPVNTVVSSSSTSADRRDGHGEAPSAPAEAAKASPEAPAPPPPESPAAALRMIIEPFDGGAGYTYKFYDRATGALVMELPPEQAAKLGESADYTAGQLISQTA